MTNNFLKKLALLAFGFVLLNFSAITSSAQTDMGGIYFSSGADDMLNDGNVSGPTTYDYVGPSYTFDAGLVIPPIPGLISAGQSYAGGSEETFGSYDKNSSLVFVLPTEVSGNFIITPEPSTWSLMAVAGIGLIAFRRKIFGAKPNGN